jgi:Whi5 like
LHAPPSGSSGGQRVDEHGDGEIFDQQLIPRCGRHMDQVDLPRLTLLLVPVLKERLDFGHSTVDSLRSVCEFQRPKSSAGHCAMPRTLTGFGVASCRRLTPGAGNAHGLKTRLQLAAVKLKTGWSSMPFVATPPWP